MKQLATLLILLVSCSLFAQRKSLTLHYATDKSELTLAHRTEVDQLLDEIKHYPIQQINIIGHTDTVASVTYNQALSRRRAEGLYNYLLVKGIAVKLIQYNWQGESEARSPQNLLEDRRVTLEVNYIIPLPEPLLEQATDTAIYTGPGISELYDQLRMKTQEFCIDPGKDTLLRCAMGTIINIKAGSFRLNPQQQKSNTCIRFQVKEAFLKSDMILENLTTTADGKILETQGMIFTNALLGSDTLELQKEIAVMIPADNIIENQQVLDGVRDPHTDIINWSINNNSVLRNFTVMDIADCLKYNELWKRCNGGGAIIAVNRNTQRARCITRLWLACGREPCERCKILFCRVKRIGRPIKGLAKKSVRKENKEFRACQKILRRAERFRKRAERFERNGWRLSAADFAWIRRNFIRKKALKGEVEMTARELEIFELTNQIEETDKQIKAGMVNKQLMNQCNELDSLFEAYGVDNTDALVVAINQPLMDEFGVSTLEALLDTLPKVNFENMEVAYRNKKISYEDFKFYIFNSSKLGWKNLDVFANIPRKDQVKLKVNLVPEKQVDCKLVFKDRQFVLPGKLGDDHFYFEGIPKGESAWLVALKYENGIPLLAMHNITVAKSTFELAFKALTLQELKEQLKILDFE